MCTEMLNILLEIIEKCNVINCFFDHCIFLIWFTTSVIWKFARLMLCVFVCVRLVCLSLPDGCFSHSFVVFLSFGGDESFMASRNGSGLYSTPDKMATSFEGKPYPCREFKSYSILKFLYCQKSQTDYARLNYSRYLHCRNVHCSLSYYCQHNEDRWITAISWHHSVFSCVESYTALQRTSQI